MTHTKEKRVFDDDVYNKLMVPDASRASSYMEEVKDADKLIELCIKYVPFWNDLHKNDIQVRIITISLTNKVYMVGLVKPESGSRRLNKVLLRMIADEKHVLYDIPHQNEVYKLLGDMGFCPKVVSVFPGGRIEEWLEGFVLHSNSLSNVSVLTSVATLLAKFHKTITSVAPKTWDRTPSLVKKMESWLPLCKKANHDLKLGFNMSEIEEYVHTYKTYLGDYLEDLNDGDVALGASPDPGKMSHDDFVKYAGNYSATVLFCHNDLHLKNLIATHDGLTLIDFEYSSFNYAGADIGFFFLESIFDYDYPQYPFFKVDPKGELSYELKAMFASVYLSEALGKNVMPNDNEVLEPFLLTVELLGIGTLLFWALWGIVMKSLSERNEQFDYVEYAKEKFKLFDSRFDDFHR